MSFWQKASQLCVYFLMLIAAWVAVLLFLGRPAWPTIVGYWLVLTGKNACDVLALRSKQGLRRGGKQVTETEKARPSESAGRA